MDNCTEEKLEMEQTDAVYSLGRALRGAFAPNPQPIEDAAVAALLRPLDAIASARTIAGD